MCLLHLYILKYLGHICNYMNCTQPTKNGRIGVLREQQRRMREEERRMQQEQMKVVYRRSVPKNTVGQREETNAT